MNRLLITGAGSKLAKPLTDLLIDKYDLIFHLTRKSEQAYNNPKVQYIKHDLRTFEELEVGFDSVIHLAAHVP